MIHSVMDILLSVDVVKSLKTERRSLVVEVEVSLWPLQVATEIGHVLHVRFVITQERTLSLFILTYFPPHSFSINENWYSP